MALVMSEQEIRTMRDPHHGFDDTFPAPYGTGQGEFDALGRHRPNPRSKWEGRLLTFCIAAALIGCLWAIFAR